MINMQTLQVSIPFKRESVSKEHNKKCHSHFIRRVSIPFKRESVSKVRCETDRVSEDMFQFPSNGKVYPKSNPDQDGRRERWVSIPFKRESVSKEHTAGTSDVTRRVVSIPFKRESVSKGSVTVGSQSEAIDVVSIPFKRESVSKVCLISCSFLTPFLSFNSLQTGKCIQSNRQNIPLCRKHRMFQFPSNGKVSPKLMAICRSAEFGFSFNSLQTGKCIQSIAFIYIGIGNEYAFQFPSNGKVSPKFQRPDLSFRIYRFQFPSNGKVSPKLYYAGWMPDLLVTFQFPSNGKVSPKRVTTTAEGATVYCFNSLQTGKHIQSEKGMLDVNGQPNKFPFPSNGKAYPKRVGEAKHMADTLKTFPFPSNGKAYPKEMLAGASFGDHSFHSLQTGKHIQRSTSNEHSQINLMWSFHSLQTGKHIQSDG